MAGLLSSDTGLILISILMVLLFEFIVCTPRFLSLLCCFLNYFMVIVSYLIMIDWFVVQPIQSIENCSFMETKVEIYLA